MNNRLLKIKAKGILFLISFFKKAGFFIFWFFEKISEFIELLFLHFIKIFFLPFFPIYLKLKILIKKYLSNFHYQSGFFSLLDQKRLLLFCLLLILIFIFFEERTSFQEEFFAQAISLKEEREISSDFKIALENNEVEEAILKPNITFEKEFIPTRTEVEKYVVEPGDTVSSIAEDFGVSINTILWENKLTARSIIRPGQILRILPVSGVSHKVKSGDTIKKIAQNYRANEEDVIRFNDLEEEPLKIGDIIIIPEGRIPPPPPTPRIFRGTDKTWLAEIGETKRKGENCRNFYPGQCTWYIAQKICITFSGHAKSWLLNAQRAGYAIGRTPQVSAIVSLRETWYGHVGIVEEVRSNSIVISEMNHLGPWKVNRREIKLNDWRINGYIYP